MPNRRSARELALALWRAMGTSLLAPEIRALGDMEEEDGLAAFGPDVLDLPPALSPAQRRGALAKLVQAWRAAEGGEKLPPASLLAAADELGALIDQAALVGGVDWTQLSGVTEELAPQLADHWRLSARFLDIVMTAWPDYLKDNGVSDMQTRRLAAAEALATRWSGKLPERPVIIAGSTGAGAATRRLMEAVLLLPRGLIVFPGVDPDLANKVWAAVADAPSHPQHALGETLKWLRLKPTDIHLWPKSEETLHERSRRRLLNEALAPAQETRGWNDRLKALAQPGTAHDMVQAALHGVALVEAEDEAEEALAAALLLRETLETKDKTGALVTPEASLARRVAALLERWGVDVAPSAGVPLHHTAAGSMVLLVARWAQDPAEPVHLLALLKHRLTALGRSEAELRARVSELERAALRGPRLDKTLEELAGRLEHATPALPAAAKLVRDLDTIWHPHRHVVGAAAIDGRAASGAIWKLAEAIAEAPRAAGSRVWAGKQGAMAAQFLEQLAQLSDSMAGIEAGAFADFADSIMQGMTAAPDAPEHPRIAIWGPLEARLQRRDRMILASLNEGTWPKPATADAFLNRALRKKLGLPDPDERIGLSAHDFAQMANAPEVILLRARRVDDKPAVASRWVWRLRTLAAGGLGREAAEAALKPKPQADPLTWAKAVRSVAVVKSVPAPQPRPPADKRRLARFSPSRVVTLIRDPYADFARRILQLERLRRVGEEIDPASRGTAVHEAIEMYEAADNEKPLDELIVERLLLAGASRDLIHLEKPLWVRAVGAYAAWASRRRAHVVRVALEKTAAVVVETEAGQIELKAKADRVELRKDGKLAIVDFKTGAPRSAKQVQSGLEPQLPLEAAIAAHAAFGDIGPGTASELIYFQISTSAAVLKAKNGEPLELDEPVPVIAEKALAGLQRLIAAYARPGQPYLSRPRVFSVRVISDYDRLARRAEWTVEEGEE